MDEGDKVMVARIDENVKFLKHHFPRIMERVGSLEGFRERQQTHNKWTKALFGALFGIFLAIISGSFINFKK